MRNCVNKTYHFQSLRTLRRKLEDFKVQSVISEEFFKFLRCKASIFEEQDKECGLIYDEMSILSKRVFDTSTNSMFGEISFPDEHGIATHAIAFMITGTARRWKHVVGYYFTGDSFIVMLVC